MAYKGTEAELPVGQDGLGGSVRWRVAGLPRVGHRREAGTGRLEKWGDARQDVTSWTPQMAVCHFFTLLRASPQVAPPLATCFSYLYI